MIKYQEAKFKELVGEYPAEIVAVEPELNNFYKPDEKNSTEYVLSITFQLEDNGEAIMHTQKFVAPITGGKGLFQQLLDIISYLPDIEQGEFDEQKLVGTKLIVSMGKNKKGYRTVEFVTK